MLRRKQRRHVNAGVQHSINVPPPLSIDAAVIGNEADSLALDLGKALIGPDVETGKHLAVARHLAMHTGAGQSVVIAGQTNARRLDPECRRDDGWHSAA